MSGAVTHILKEIGKLSPADQAELRRAIEDQPPVVTTDPALTLHDADLQLVASTWDKLGPSPDVDYDAL